MPGPDAGAWRPADLPGVADILPGLIPARPNADSLTLLRPNVILERARTHAAWVLAFARMTLGRTVNLFAAGY
jgi:hypothetical protein